MAYFYYGYSVTITTIQLFINHFSFCINEKKNICRMRICPDA